MTQNVDALRRAKEDETEELDEALAARLRAQLLLADAEGNLSAQELRVAARRREIAFLDAEIDRIEAETADDPTTIPAIPLEPANPNQPEPEEEEEQE